MFLAYNFYNFWYVVMFERKKCSTSQTLKIRRLATLNELHWFSVTNTVHSAFRSTDTWGVSIKSGLNKMSPLSTPNGGCAMFSRDVLKIVDWHSTERLALNTGDVWLHTHHATASGHVGSNDEGQHVSGHGRRPFIVVSHKIPRPVISQLSSLYFLNACYNKPLSP